MAGAFSAKTRGWFVVCLCLAGVAASSTVAQSAVASSPSERLLVVAAAPSSFRSVAHLYDGRGRLLDTVKGPPFASLDWSPDGKLLAVVTRTGVWVEHADGSARRQLFAIPTCTGTCIGAVVAWTPDSRRLAVGGVGANTEGFDLVDLATGSVKVLRPPKPTVGYVPIAFSPNGRLLAYSITGGDAGTASCCLSALVVAHADGTHPRVLRSFADPIHDGPGAATWSPDSSQIAFTDDGRDPKDPRLAIVDVRSGKLHALNPRNVYDQSAAWSPDGTRLALAQSKGSAFTIAVGGGSFDPLAVNGTYALWLKGGDILIARSAYGHVVSIFAHGHAPARNLFTLPGREQLVSLHQAR